ncbi:hypothetical protein Btru_017941 [Bulinus truncatus]|nr:hypothetical protein Btru_017941 [Bulinus truncatus]
MENPLCVGLNICQNIGAKPLEVLKEAMRDAALKLEGFATSQKITGPKLSSLFSEKPAISKLSILFQSSESEQTLDVEELISDGPLNSEVEALKSREKNSPNEEILTNISEDVSSPPSDNISHSPSPSKDISLNQPDSSSHPAKCENDYMCVCDDMTNNVYHIVETIDTAASDGIDITMFVIVSSYKADCLHFIISDEMKSLS